MEHYFTNNENLDSNLRVLTYNYKGETFSFYSDLGVFSKDRIDYGSRLLVETFFELNKRKSNRVLDVGCGIGYIGITISKILNISSDMIDINKRCIHLTEMNIKKNDVRGNVFLSNIYENVTNKYDLIISNPPIRAGKQIVLEILLKAKEYLMEEGELWFVMRKDHGAKSTLKCLENVYNCEIMKKNKGFYIIKCKIR